MEVVPGSSRVPPEVMIKPLSEVDEAFAWDEGEGDRTRDWWLAAIADISLDKRAAKGLS